MDSPTLISMRAKMWFLIVVAIGMIILLFVIAFIVSTSVLPINYGYALFIIVLGAVILSSAYAEYLNVIVKGHRQLLGLEGHSAGGYWSNLSSLANQKIMIPYNFTSLNKNYRTLYREALDTYLSDYPDSAIPVIVRLIELGIKEKYNQLTKEESSKLDQRDSKFMSNLTDVMERKSKDKIDLFDLIECASPYYEGKKELLQYLRTLRNLIHTPDTATDNEALLAFIKVNESLLILFGLSDKIDFHVNCEICGQMHSYNIDSSSYYIGDKMTFECSNKGTQTENRNYAVTVMP